MPVCIRLAAKTMWLMARFRVLLAFVLLVSHPGALIAHQAFFTASAAHIGPDGAVTIRVRFDLLAYALNDTSARIGNEPMEELLNGPRALLEKRLMEARERFLHGVSIMTDAGNCAPGSIEFPDADAVDAYKLSASTLLPVVMEAKLIGRLPTGAKSVAFRFPNVLDLLVLSVERPGEDDYVEPLEPGAVSSQLPVHLIVPSSKPITAQIGNERIPPEPAPTVGTLPPSSGDSLVSLVQTKHISIPQALLFLIFAAGLGGTHALSPGHGKTLVAAYLIGSRGTLRHAVILGLVVAATHTAGVFALGLATLYASRYILPDSLYPWLTVGSGVVISQIGFARLFGTGHAHSHSHGHTHPHVHHHGNGHTHSHIPPDGASLISWKSLLALGISGGIVPCASAIVVLLSAIALHRIEFGLLLIVAFSIGLATVLSFVGILMVTARDFLNSRIYVPASVVRLVPRIGGLVIACIGLAIALPELKPLVKSIESAIHGAPREFGRPVAVTQVCPWRPLL